MSSILNNGLTFQAKPNDLFKASVSRSLGNAASGTGAIGNREDVSVAPLPLQRDVPDPHPYPFDALGEVLGEAAKRICEVVQAPDAICAQSVLSVASLCTQPYANVVCDGRRYPLSLYLQSIADSGERKSAADEVALAPVRAWQKVLVDASKEEKKIYRFKRDVWKREYDSIISGKGEAERQDALEALGDEPCSPREPLIICDEPTYEGLAKYLEKGQPSFAVFSDEGGRVMTGHSMRENVGNMTGGLSQLWDGKPLDRMRAKEGASILYGRRVSLHLLMQPIFLILLKKNQILREQGLLARFLTVYPKAMAGRRTYQEVDLSRDEVIQRFYACINGFLDQKFPTPPDRPDELAPRDLEVDLRAKTIWMRYNDSVDQAIGEGGRLSPIKAMASKAPNQVMRIAGILTLIKNCEAMSVSTDEMAAAIVLMDFYLEEALRIEGVAGIDPDLELAGKVLSWLVKKQKTVFELQDVYRNGPLAVRDAKKARKMLLILQEHKHIVPCDGRWGLNPCYCPVV